MIHMSAEDVDDDVPRQESKKTEEPEVRLRELLGQKSTCTPARQKKYLLDKKIAETKAELAEKIKRLEHQVQMKNKAIKRLRALRNSA